VIIRENVKNLLLFDLKSMKPYYTPLLLLLVCTLTAFLPQEAESEYGRWLTFHQLDSTAFEQRGEHQELQLNWEEYDLSTDYFLLFEPFFMPSPDAAHFIDMDSYSLILEKNEKGKLFSPGSGVDMKVQLVSATAMTAAILLFCSTECYPETAVWRTNQELDIIGFKINSQYEFVPTLWKIDMGNGSFTEFCSKKIFHEMPPSYGMKKRLEQVEFTY
jgi:hypothetical protein